MKNLWMICLIVVSLTGYTMAQDEAKDGWMSLFDGKTLDGWKFSEDPGTFSVKDGLIVVHGKRSHLYYVGADSNASWTNFEFKADVKAEPGSNSGIYFHTQFYSAEHEGAIRFNDPLVSINWPLPVSEISEKDAKHPYLPSDFNGFSFE